MRNQMAIMIAASIGIAVAAENADAGFYKCQSSDGTVRYQETPCGVGNRGTRLPTRSPAETQRAFPTEAATWGDVRRAKSQCDENARRRYGEDDPKRNQSRVDCMRRIDRACSDKTSSRCRSALRSTGRTVERARKTRKRSAPGDLELSTAKANCHAWSSSEPHYNTRRNRERACQALAASCRTDRYGPDCRQRILQLQAR